MKSDVRCHGLGFWSSDEPLSVWLSNIEKPEPLQSLDASQWQSLLRVAGYLGPSASWHQPSVFQGRLLFPISDSRGRVCALSGRVVPGVNTADTKAKYRNSPESEVFDKSQTLFGQVPAEFVLKDKGMASQWRTVGRGSVAFLVEGYTDVVTLMRLNVKAFAAMGTAISRAHIKRLLRYADHVILLTDGDAAGQRSARRGLLEALACISPGQQIDARMLPAGKDPDTFASAIEDANTFMREIATLDRWTMEDVWFEEVIGTISTPLSVSARVRLERAVFGAVSKGELPAGPEWQLAFRHWLFRKTGYWVGDTLVERKQYATSHELPPINAGSVNALWLLRFARAPEQLCLAVPYLERWWARDCRLGLLASGESLPGILRLIFTIAHLCKDHLPLIGGFGPLCEAALQAGVPSQWLYEWMSVVRNAENDALLSHYLNEAVIPELWANEFAAWMEALDASLTDEVVREIESLPL